MKALRLPLQIVSDAKQQTLGYRIITMVRAIRALSARLSQRTGQPMTIQLHHNWHSLGHDVAHAGAIRLRPLRAVAFRKCAPGWRRFGGALVWRLGLAAG
jgi:hypothetical protein